MTVSNYRRWRSRPRTSSAPKKLTVVADKGYYNGDELRACEQNDIVAYVAKPKTSPNKAKGYFDRSRFKYIREDDEYECPAGERLTFRCQSTERWQADPALLELGVRKLRDQSAMHQRQGTSCQSLGARGCSRSSREAATAKTRGDAGPTIAGRAPVRHAEVVDQLKSLPDEAIIGREYRDQPADPGLQHETSDQPGRNKKNHGGDRSIGSFVSKKSTQISSTKRKMSRRSTAVTLSAASYHTASATSRRSDIKEKPRRSGVSFLSNRACRSVTSDSIHYDICVRRQLVGQFRRELLSALRTNLINETGQYRTGRLHVGDGQIHLCQRDFVS